MDISLLSLVGASCVVGGSISVSPIAGTGPFEFQLNGGAWQSSGSFSNLPPANYSITLRDAAGCTHSSDYSIAAPPPVDISLLTLVDATCVVGGSITVSPIAGTGPFEFQLNGGAWQSSGSFSNLPPADYSIALRDAAGCTQMSDYSVAAPQPVDVSLVSLMNATCILGGAISVTAAGTAPFEFQLNGGVWQPSGTFSNLFTGVYSVTLRDAAGCTQVRNFQIQEEAPLLIHLDGIGNIDCKHPLGFLAASASGGSGGYIFQLDSGLQSNLEGSFMNLSAGLYAVTVTDSVGCSAILQDLEVDDLIDTALTRETVIIYEGSSYELPDGHRTAQPGEYPFLYQTIEGCDSLHLIELIVLKRHIYVPNVFMPNHDGLNNFFTVYADESLEIVSRLAVYGRWGELIFEKLNLPPNDEEDGWDGNYRGRPVNPGVFVWVAELKFRDGLGFVISGNVTVVR